MGHAVLPRRAADSPVAATTGDTPPGGRSRRPLVEETVTVSARADRLAALHELLDRFWAAVDRTLPRPPPDDWRYYFSTALGEIGANIVRHAHPQGTAPGTMRLVLRAYADRLEARFSDRGVPYEGDAPSAMSDIAPPLSEIDVAAGANTDPLGIPEGGYGLKLVLSAVDKLDYSRTPAGLNRWRLVKRLPAP